MDGLQGLVKIPKGGKVKKGWKIVYLAFSENNLIMHENEEEFQIGSNGNIICNIQCDIFEARSVSQNELIHANARDIDRIFKIQTYTPKFGTGEEVKNIILL